MELPLKGITLIRRSKVESIDRKMELSMTSFSSQNSVI